MRERLAGIAAAVEQSAIVGFVGSLPVSIAFNQISLGVAWAAFLVKAACQGRWPGWRTPLDKGILAFLTACLVATVFSPHPLASLMGLKKFYLVSGVFLVGFGTGSWRRIHHLCLLYIGMTVLTSAYGLSVYVLGRQWTLLGTQTMALTASGIIMMASLLSFGLAVGLHARSWRIWAAAATAGLALCMLFTKSLSSWLGWLSGALVLLMSRSRWRTAVVVVLAGIAVLTVVGLRPSRLLYNYNFREYKTWSWMMRLTIWRTGWEIIKDRPITGYGLVDLNEYYRAKREGLTQVAVEDKRTFGHLHNNFLQVLAISGVIGLAAFCYMLWTVLRLSVGLANGGPPESVPYAAGILAAQIAFLVNGLAEWNYGDSEVMTIFWTATGLALAAWRLSGNRADAASVTGPSGEI